MTSLMLVVHLALAVESPPELYPAKKIANSRPFAFGLFVAGALSGFVAHEAGHILANAAMGNTPRWVGLKAFGFVPFFAISPEVECRRESCVDAHGRVFGPGRMGMYTISTAGFDVQHLSSEFILSQAPDLRLLRAPYRKGWLAFNILLSLGYALSCVLNIEDSHGDAQGAAYVAHMPPWAFSSVLAFPALLDIYRYQSLGASWATWSSRVGKLGMIGITFAL